MKEKRFELIVACNGYEGKSVDGARMVLVGGMSLTGAAARCGCTPQGIHRCMSRIKSAHKRVYGSEE